MTKEKISDLILLNDQEIEETGEAILEEIFIQIKEFQDDKYNIPLGIFFNKQVVAWPAYEEPELRELQSPEWKAVFTNYVKNNLANELKQTARNVVFDALFYASKKSKYGLDLREWYGEEIKERQKKEKHKHKNLGYESRGRKLGTGEKLTLNKVEEVMRLLPTNKRSQNNVAELLEIDPRTLRTWCKVNSYNWEKLKNGKYSG